MKSIFKFCLAISGVLAASSAASANTVLISSVPYVLMSSVPYKNAATLSAGETLVTDFGTNPSVASVPIYLPGYSFTWTDNNGNSPGSTTVNSNTTGVYSNTILISGIAAPPPGDSGDYFAVLGSSGKATLTAPRALTSLSMLWGSLDAYNTISFIGGGPASSYSFSNPPANGDQSSDDTNREVLFTFDPADDIQQVVFGSTQNSFEFDNLAVTAVPEPAAWALFLMGFGGIGAAMRLSGRKIRSAVAMA